MAEMSLKYCYISKSDHQHALVFRCQVYQLQGNDCFINASTAVFRK